MRTSSHSVRGTIATLAIALAVMVVRTAHASTPFFLETAVAGGPTFIRYSVAVAPDGEPAIAYSINNGTDLDLYYARKIRGTWTVLPAVDVAGSVGIGPSLAFDQQGRAVIAYGDGTNNRIRVATQNGTGWTIETAVTGVAGFPIHLVIDGSGYPRIAYMTSGFPNQNLWYAAKGASGWGSPEPVSTGNVYQTENFGFALDNSGVPHMSFTQATSGHRPYHAYKSGTTWLSEPVENATPLGGYGTGLAVSSTGTIGVCYTDESGGAGFYRLKYRAKTGTSWSPPEFVGNYENPNAPVLAMDGSGAPRIGYLYVDWSGATPNGIHFATKSGSTWTPEVVTNPTGSFFLGLSMALDANASPVILNENGTPGALQIADAGVRLYEPFGGEFYPQYYDHYLRWGGVGTVTVEASEDNGFSWSYQGSMLGNGPNNSSTAFTAPPFVSAHCLVRITRSTPAATAKSENPFTIFPPGTRTWTPQSVDATGRTGKYPSIAQEGGVVGIAYYDSTNGDIRYASSCSGGPWTSEPVATSGTLGQLTSLKIVQGVPRIVYTDQTNSTVVLATRGFGGWTFETVYSGSASRPTLAVDASGNVNIAFWAANTIWYVYKNAGVWTPESVGSAPLSGEASIAVTSTGAPRIAWFSQWLSTNCLNYATRTGPNAWSNVPLETGNSKGFGCSLVLNPQDLARVSYLDLYDSWQKHVRIATQGTSGWTWGNVVTTADDMGYFTSLAMNASDQPMVVFQSKGLFQMYSPGGYDDLGPATSGPGSICASAAGNPRIAYYEMVNGDVNALLSVPDDVSPGAVTTVGAAFGRTTSVVSWTFTGDDGSNCQASGFEVRESPSPISSETAWAGAATIASGAAGAPGASGCANEMNLDPCTPHWYAVKISDEAGHWSTLGNTAGGSTRCSGHVELVCDNPSAASEAIEESVPRVLELRPMAPNPVSGSGVMELAIPSRSAGQNAELVLFDISGRRIRTLLSGAVSPGMHRIEWDGRNEAGVRADRGVYFARLRVGVEVRSQRIVLSP